MQIDAIVIGGGFGGAITATRLVEGGLKVALLERGPWWDSLSTRSMGIARRTPLPRGLGLVTHAVRSIYHPWIPRGPLRFNSRGLIEFYSSQKIDIMCGSGIGGGSHLYSGIYRRPARADFWNGICDGLDEDAMAPHYEKFRRQMGVVRASMFRDIPMMSRDVFAASQDIEPAPSDAETWLGFLIDDEPGDPKIVRYASGLERMTVDYYSGDDGFLGSPNNSKNTVDVTYLSGALERGLIVKDLSEVRLIRKMGKMRKRFEVEIINHVVGKHEIYQCNYLFLCAGTLNTLRLLLLSRDKYHSIQGMTELGKCFGANGDTRGYWDINAEDLNFTLGLPSKGGVRLKGGEDCYVPLGCSVLPNIASYPLPRFLKDRLRRGVVLTGMGIDAMDGTVTLRHGRFTIDFDPGNSDVFGRIFNTMSEISRRTGRKVYISRKASTVHPLGGARLGSCAANGVVGANGEVHDIPGLYIVDGSIFPAPIGAPPTMSIGAWAENVAYRFLNK